MDVKNELETIVKDIENTLCWRSHSSEEHAQLLRVKVDALKALQKYEDKQ